MFEMSTARAHRGAGNTILGRLPNLTKLSDLGGGCCGAACFAGALAAWAGVTALLNTLALESAILLLSLREQVTRHLYLVLCLQCGKACVGDRIGRPFCN